MSDREPNRTRQILGWGIVGLVVVIGVSIVLSFFSQRLDAFHYPFFPFRFGLLGGIFLLFIILWIAKWLLWPWTGLQGRENRNPESILKQRYAKGEITKEQFENMMHDLEKGSKI